MLRGSWRSRCGVAPAEHLRVDSAYAVPELPGARLAHVVAHEVHDAALSCRPLEDLRRRDEAPVHIGDDELHAVNAAVADLPEEGQPRVVRLGVNHVGAQYAPPAARVAADGRDHGGGGDAPFAAALDVGVFRQEDLSKKSIGN